MIIKMRILLLNTSEQTGGAAIAANRLMKALNKNGVEAKMLVRDKRSDDSKVYTVNTSWFKRKINFIRFLWERLIIFIATGFDRKNLFRVSIANTGTDISKHPFVQEADVIHLHWTNQGFLSLSDIKKLIAIKKPVVWTMHDCWIMNGIYHYPEGEESGIKSLVDLDKKFLKKKARLELSKVTFVGCSKWIVNEAKRSQLLSGASILSIPNPIDLNVFCPIEKREARSILSLPQDKFILLFTAAKVSDKRKGLAYFIQACNILKEQYPGIAENTEVAVMGAKEEIETHSLPVHHLGYVSDAKKMIAAYSCAEIFVIPSLEDNLPNTIMESMACGVPCVGFNVGGIPEMIDHKQNGYVADYKDPQDLARGIEWVLSHPDKQALSEACIKKVEENYAEAVVARQYIELYTNSLQ